MLTKRDKRERLERFAEDVERIRGLAEGYGLRLRVQDVVISRKTFRKFHWMFDSASRQSGDQPHVLEYWPSSGTWRATFRTGRQYVSKKEGGPILTPDEALQLAAHLLEHDALPPGGDRTLFPERS